MYVLVYVEHGNDCPSGYHLCSEIGCVLSSVACSEAVKCEHTYSNVFKFNIDHNNNYKNIYCKKETEKWP